MIEWFEQETGEDAKKKRVIIPIKYAEATNKHVEFSMEASYRFWIQIHNKSLTCNSRLKSFLIYCRHFLAKCFD
jgi:hypothetical protein